MLDSGDTAPDFGVVTTASDIVRLSGSPDDGPVLVVVFRGPWYSDCAEQFGTFSELAYDLRRNHDSTILPVTGASKPALAEMCDPFDLRCNWARTQN